MSAIIHPALHAVFEALGYSVGGLFYLRTSRPSHDSSANENRWLLLATCAISALAGSRILGFIEEAYARGWNPHALATSGEKTVVGGLLGAFIALRVLQVQGRTKFVAVDALAAPVCLALAIARIGCFLAGLADDTYGNATSLPWGVNFGDGVMRHPTQLYETIFLTGLTWFLWRKNKQSHTDGKTWRLFITVYLVWRLFIDFLKPEPALALSLSVIQCTCLAGLLALIVEGLIHREPSI